MPECCELTGGSATPGCCQSPCTHALPTATSCAQGGTCSLPLISLAQKLISTCLPLEVLYNRTPPQVCLVFCSDHLTTTHPHGSEQQLVFHEALQKPLEGNNATSPAYKVEDRGKSSLKATPYQGQPF